MSAVRWWLIPIIPVLCTCSLLKSDGPAEGEETRKALEGPELIGRVASIAADRRFVLIQSYGTWKRESGTILTARGGDDRVANLLVTGEALGQFAAADIQSGTVEIGDAVYSLHVPKPVEPTARTGNEAEMTENQLIKEFENVQKNN